MFSKARLDASSDGIFGVAVTPLILKVRLADNFHPKDGAELFTPHFEPGDHMRHRQMPAMLLVASSLLAIAPSFVNSSLALWAR